jgi:hypothetical protein
MNTIKSIINKANTGTIALFAVLLLGVFTVSLLSMQKNASTTPLFSQSNRPLQNGSEPVSQAPHTNQTSSSSKSQAQTQNASNVTSPANETNSDTTATPQTSTGTPQSTTTSPMTPILSTPSPVESVIPQDSVAQPQHEVVCRVVTAPNSLTGALGLGQPLKPITATICS